MKAKDKLNLMAVLVVVAILVENYLVYSCLFDGRRGYMELLLCGFFAHIVVAIIVGLILNAIIPVEYDNPKNPNISSESEAKVHDGIGEDNASSITDRQKQSLPTDADKDMPIKKDTNSGEGGNHVQRSKLESVDNQDNYAAKEEPPELGVRQKIEIAQCLYNNSCIAVAEAYEKVFVKYFPSNMGSGNQMFVLCMQAAVSWLTMYSYDCRHSKARTAQIMGWLELASRSRNFPMCVVDMQERKYSVVTNDAATFDEKMLARCETYAKWILDVMNKKSIILDGNVLKEQLYKAFQFVQFWYDDKLQKLIVDQKPFDPILPRDCAAGSIELKWIEQCKSDIAKSKW